MMDKKNLGIESIQKSLLRLKLGGLSLKLQEVLAAAKGECKNNCVWGL